MKQVRALWIATAAALVATGCFQETYSRGGGGPAPPAPVIDGCPAGGTLRITLWDVFATPRRPDGDVWDGAEAGTATLFCEVGADLIRRRVREAALAELGPVGDIGDRLVGDAFQQTIAELCGLATNWLQEAYEGPDLAAFGAFDGDAEWRWETIQVEDTWAARLNTTTAGTWATWDIPCDTAGYVGILAVEDRDITFTDEVGAVALDLTIPDQVICDGWGFYEGTAGIAGILVRVEVLGATPVCP